MLFGLLGILAGLGLLIWLSYRGWSVLLLAPAAALVAAAAAGEPLLAHWTETFMGGAAKFLAQFFPLFLLGALFGKLMDDSGSVETIARFMTEKLGTARAILAVTLAGAIVTYGGVSLFVAFFVLVPMAQSLFKAADIPHRLVPAADRSRHHDLHHVGVARHPCPAKCHSHAVLRHHALRGSRPRHHRRRHHARLRAVVAQPRRRRGAPRRRRLRQARASRRGGAGAVGTRARHHRERIRPAEIAHGRHAESAPSVLVAFLPLIVVILVNLAMSLFVLPRLDTSYLAEARWGATSLAAVGGVWAVVVALFAAILTLIALNYRRLPSLRESMDAGANASVLPAFSVASLVGFGAVIAALPAFTLVRDWVLSIGGGPLVSLAVATNVLAALTGSASGGLTIALDALGETYLRLASEHGIDPALLHRVAVMSAGTLDSLPHNGAVVTLLAVCGVTHRDSYKDIFVVAIVGALARACRVIVLGSIFGIVLS